jgi:hypothetical protein
MYSSSTSSKFSWFWWKIWLQVSGEDLAKRTVDSKPVEASSKIRDSSFSLACVAPLKSHPAPARVTHPATRETAAFISPGPGPDQGRDGMSLLAGVEWASSFKPRRRRLPAGGHQ